MQSRGEAGRRGYRVRSFHSKYWDPIIVAVEWCDPLVLVQWWRKRFRLSRRSAYFCFLLASSPPNPNADEC